jgi:hypothetical protein
MGLLKLTESERLEILNLHNNARVIKEQAPSVVAAGTAAPTASTTVPTAATTMDRKTLVTKIQDILKTKYKADLGPKGADGVLGPKTLAALTTAMANKTKAAPVAAAAPTGTTQTGTATPVVAAGTAAPAGTTQTGTATPVAGQPSTAKLLNVIPNVSYQTQSPSGTTQTGTVEKTPVEGDDEFGGEVPPQSNRSNRRARQDLRRGNRRAMQDLRASQQNQQQ